MALTLNRLRRFRDRLMFGMCERIKKWGFPEVRCLHARMVDEEGILYADLDPKIAIQERQNLDISGHYSRFDIFNKPLDDI